MDLQTRKFHFIEAVLSINNDAIMGRLESVLKEEQQKLDPTWKGEATSRAFKAGEAIKKGEICSREEAERRIKERMGL